jgi:hypothetical protein
MSVRQAPDRCRLFPLCRGSTHVQGHVQSGHANGAERLKSAEPPFESSIVRNLRKTGSTLLEEAGFNGDWIEKSLASGLDGRFSRALCNKAEYALALQRQRMLQQ